MKIINTSPSDLEDIIRWFDASVAYQKERGYPAWENYDHNAVRRDIENGNSYKIVIENTPAMAFSVTYNDKIIWRHLDDEPSIYLHRIVVNPAFKGQKLFGSILDWAIDHAKGKKIRMDTWADNPAIINYYKGFGFEIIEDYTTPDSEELPVHNRNLSLTLLQFNSSHR